MTNSDTKSRAARAEIDALRGDAPSLPVMRYVSFALFAVAPRTWDRLHTAWCSASARWRYWRMTPDERAADTAEIVARARLFIAAWEIKEGER